MVASLAIPPPGAIGIRRNVRVDVGFALAIVRSGCVTAAPHVIASVWSRGVPTVSVCGPHTRCTLVRSATVSLVSAQILNSSLVRQITCEEIVILAVAHLATDGRRGKVRFAAIGATIDLMGVLELRDLMWTKRVRLCLEVWVF